MASLNLSINGSSISKSYQSVVNAPKRQGPAADSPTYSQWALFSVSAPLASAFQQDSGSKESVLKVQDSGEGDLSDLIDEFSDGKIQFAFAKVRDPNTTLPKHVLISWCGEGVPERTKGYFTSHQSAVAKVLHGYHVQITARSDRDLTPESIVQRVADSSGSRYTPGHQVSQTSPPPPIASKPVFMPTQVSSGSANMVSSSSRQARRTDQQVTDIDGWGEDAPQVTRTGLEKVEPAYKPTKVDIHQLASQSRASPRTGDAPDSGQGRPEVVKGAYRPIGRVDIEAIRREARGQEETAGDRPEPVRGAYEPVGKVDIAAIRARAKPPSETLAKAPESSSPVANSSTYIPEKTTQGANPAGPLASERLTVLPKPKVSNRFGAGTASFGGAGSSTLKAPAFSPTGPSPAPVGASRTFANQGGKTPAQLWAEKKGQRGDPKAMHEQTNIGLPSTKLISEQTSGTGEWKSGYTGKTWAPVQTSRSDHTEGVQIQNSQQDAIDDDAGPEQPPSAGVGSIRERFNSVQPPVAQEELPSLQAARSPPPLATSTKPNAGVNVVPQIPASDDDFGEQNVLDGNSRESQEEYEESSPIRVAMPVPSIHNKVEESDDLPKPPPSPPALDNKRSQDHDEAQSIANDISAVKTSSSPSIQPDKKASSVPTEKGINAVVQFDYEKAEDNELELREGEHITNIDMVDEHWWMGENSKGESGLFPSNYVQVVEESELAKDSPSISHNKQVETTPPPSGGATATALYDYEAAEDNELSFPEGATVTNVEFPDEDWWSGEYHNQSGLFPANYVRLDD